MSDQMAIGVVGLHRGEYLMRVLAHMEGAKIAAICDLDEERLTRWGEHYNIQKKQRFTRFEDLLQTELDAVIIATPVNFHAPYAIAAMEHGKHVLSEVPAAVTIDECWQLLEAAEKTGMIYMLGENVCYLPRYVLVREMVRRGLFGETYFGIGEYLHDVRFLGSWRDQWFQNVNGDTYCTHSVGPVLQWLDDRPAEVVSLGSGHHIRDVSGNFYRGEDTIVTMCKLERGGLLQIRLDIRSPRPYSNFHALQGTKGCFEDLRDGSGTGQVWLADFCKDESEWLPLSRFEEEYLPEPYKNPPEAAMQATHAGSDYWMVHEFVSAIKESRPADIDIVQGLEWTAIGLCSQISIAKRGAVVEVPNFRSRWNARQKVLDKTR